MYFLLCLLQFEVDFEFRMVPICWLRMWRENDVSIMVVTVIVDGVCKVDCYHVIGDRKPYSFSRRA